MRGPLEIQMATVGQEPAEPEEEFDAEAFVRTIDQEPMDSLSFEDGPLCFPDVASEISNP